MKKIFSIIAILAGLTACDSKTEGSAQGQQQPTQAEKEAMSKHHTLVRQPVGTLKVDK